ncbi:MAG: OmpA family protein [Phocaeicola sp.]
MKSKMIALSLLLAGATTTAVQAQDNFYTPKWNDNIFVSVGVGGMSVLNGGFNSPTLNGNISVGKYLTPTWGVRGQIGGMWQTLDAEETINGQKIKNKKFGEVNLDAMVNLINLFGGYNPNRIFDLYLFGGPTMNIAKAYDTNALNPQTGQMTHGNGDNGYKARFGATGGLGMGFSINQKWAINLEGRVGVTPSIFGYDSSCRSAEATGRLTVGATYTFGGKKFAKVSDRVVEREVVREVVREVPVEVVKEVIKEVSTPTEVAIFFKINRAVISQEGLVNIKLMAKAIKANPNATYKIAGFADKATGTSNINQSLSERRSQAVYDALIAEGVPASQLEKVAMGGTDNMFGKNYLNRVVIMEVK